MTYCYNETNLYSKDGILLLAAGQEVTESMLRKIESLDCTEIRERVEQNEKIHYKNDIKSSTDKIQVSLILRIYRFLI